MAKSIPATLGLCKIPALRSESPQTSTRPTARVACDKRAFPLILTDDQTPMCNMRDTSTLSEKTNCEMTRSIRIENMQCAVACQMPTCSSGSCPRTQLRKQRRLEIKRWMWCDPASYQDTMLMEVAFSWSCWQLKSAADGRRRLGPSSASWQEPT